MNGAAIGISIEKISFEGFGQIVIQIANPTRYYKLLRL